MKVNLTNNTMPKANSNSIHFRIQEKVAIDNLEIIRVLTQGKIKLNFKITDKLNSKLVHSGFLMYLEWFLMRWDQIT